MPNLIDEIYTNVYGVTLYWRNQLETQKSNKGADLYLLKKFTDGFITFLSKLFNAKSNDLERQQLVTQLSLLDERGYFKNIISAEDLKALTDDLVDNGKGILKELKTKTERSDFLDLLQDKKARIANQNLSDTLVVPRSGQDDNFQEEADDVLVSQLEKLILTEPPASDKKYYYKSIRKLAKAYYDEGDKIWADEMLENNKKLTLAYERFTQAYEAINRIPIQSRTKEDSYLLDLANTARADALYNLAIDEIERFPSISSSDAENKNDEIINTLESAIELYEVKIINTQEYKYNLSSLYIDVANRYIKKPDYKTAMTYLDKSLTFYNDLDDGNKINLSDRLLENYISVAATFLRNQQLKECRDIYKKILALNSQIDISEDMFVKMLYEYAVVVYTLSQNLDDTDSNESKELLFTALSAIEKNMTYIDALPDKEVRDEQKIINQKLQRHIQFCLIIHPENPEYDNRREKLRTMMEELIHEQLDPSHTMKNEDKLLLAKCYYQYAESLETIDNAGSPMDYRQAFYYIQQAIDLARQLSFFIPVESNMNSYLHYKAYLHFLRGDDSLAQKDVKNAIADFNEGLELLSRIKNKDDANNQLQSELELALKEAKAAMQPKNDS